MPWRLELSVKKSLTILFIGACLFSNLKAEIETNCFKDELVNIDFNYSQDANKRSYYKASFKESSVNSLIIEQKIGTSRLMAAKFIKPSAFIVILKGEVAFYHYSYEHRDGAWHLLDEFIFSIPDSGLQNFMSSTNKDPFIPNFEIINAKEFIVRFSKSEYFGKEYIKLDSTLKKIEVRRRASELPKNLNFKVEDKKLLCNGRELKRGKWGPLRVELD